MPLLILGGARDERLARLDALLELGRRNIESERARSASALSSASEEAERARLEADIAQREQNYETWRRHVEDLRDRSVE